MEGITVFGDGANDDVTGGMTTSIDAKILRMDKMTSGIIDDALG